MRSVLLAALALSSLCAQRFPDGETLTKQAEAFLAKLHRIEYAYKEETNTETAIAAPALNSCRSGSRHSGC